MINTKTSKKSNLLLYYKTALGDIEQFFPILAFLLATTQRVGKTPIYNQYQLSIHKNNISVSCNYIIKYTVAACGIAFLMATS